MAPAATTNLIELDAWWDAIAAGHSDAEVAAKLGVPEVQARRARESLVTQEATRLSQSVGDQFAQYRVRMEAILRRIDRVHVAAMGSGKGRKPQLRTALDAATAMARVVDRTIERGQELGVLPKAITQRNTKVTVSGGVMVGAMTGEELAKGIAELAREGRRLREQYEGDQFNALPMPDPFDQGPVDLGDIVEASEPVRVTRRKA